MQVDWKRTGDRRVQKTEALLRGALGALIHEKPYEDITVKEILNRANVGRATFYMHFADKDELLLSCMRDILRSGQLAHGARGSAKPQGDIAWFSLPMFDHIERHRRAGLAALGSMGRRALHERLEHAISELIQEEIRTALRRGSHTARHAPPELLVRWIASNFMVVLNWWGETDSPLPAREADGLFRALIEPSLAEALR